jgi:signal transduction histidine kinase
MKSAERKNLFLANLSHELKTPLNAILGFSDLLLEKTPPENSVSQYVRNIREGATHLESIIKRILDVAKLQFGTFVLKEEMVRPTEIFKMALIYVSQHYPERQIVWEISKDIETFFIKCDKNLTIEVISNLVTNALKYSEQNSPVRASIRNNKNGDVIFEVVDKGYGMDESEIAIALEPFGQNLRHKSVTSSGLGLGLPFSVFVSEAHGGTLNIQSKKSGGTKVEVCYPKNRMYSNSEEEAR